MKSSYLLVLLGSFLANLNPLLPPPIATSRSIINDDYLAIKPNLNLDTGLLKHYTSDEYNERFPAPPENLNAIPPPPFANSGSIQNDKRNDSIETWINLLRAIVTKMDTKHKSKLKDALISITENSTKPLKEDSYDETPDGSLSKSVEEGDDANKTEEYQMTRVPEEYNSEDKEGDEDEDCVEEQDVATTVMPIVRESAELGNVNSFPSFAIDNKNKNIGIGVMAYSARNGGTRLGGIASGNMPQSKKKRCKNDQKRGFRSLKLNEDSFRNIRKKYLIVKTE